MLLFRNVFLFCGLLYFLKLALAADSDLNAKFLNVPTINPAIFKCPNGESYPVHFTFDDGPHAIFTPLILDILKKHNIKATFFITTSNIAPPTQGLKKIVQRAKSEGHQIASHTHKHINHADSKYPTEIVRHNIEESRRLLGEENSKLFRFPYGAGWFRFKNEVQQERGLSARKMATESLGMRHVGWDIDSWDHSATMRKHLPDSLLWQICNHKGGIVLMHDIQPFTAKNLEAIILSIKNSGHRLVGFDEIDKYSQNIGGLNSFAPQVELSSNCGSIIRGAIDQVWLSCNQMPANSIFTKETGVGVSR